MSATVKYILYFLLFLLITVGFFFLLKKIFEVAKRNKIDCNSSFLFIGDSITAYNESYADQLKTVCPNLKYKKIAQIGKQTSWMYNQLQSELANNNYDVVVILGGTNDIFSGTALQTTISNLDRMYKFAKQKGSIVVGVSIPDIAYYPKTTSSEMSKFMPLYDFIRKNKTLDFFIDFSTLTNSPSYFTSDGLHPSFIAHQYLKNRFVDIVLSK